MGTKFWTEVINLRDVVYPNVEKRYLGSSWTLQYRVFLEPAPCGQWKNGSLWHLNFDVFAEIRNTEDFCKDFLTLVTMLKHTHQQHTLEDGYQDR